MEKIQTESISYKIYIIKLVRCPLTCSGGTKYCHIKSILDITVDKWKSWTNSIEENTICIEKIVNSAFIGDILSCSLDEKILSYATELNPIKTNEQTGLTDLNFQYPLDFISLTDKNFFQEEPVLTRVEATERAKPW